jgi:hypothetical protein
MRAARLSQMLDEAGGRWGVAFAELKKIRVVF